LYLFVFVFHTLGKRREDTAKQRFSLTMTESTLLLILHCPLLILLSSVDSNNSQTY